jgi:hypothetical protein
MKSSVLFKGRTFLLYQYKQIVREWFVKLNKTVDGLKWNV